MLRWWDDAGSSAAALDLVDSRPGPAMGVAVLGFHGIAKGVLAPLAGQTLVDEYQIRSALDGLDGSVVADAIAASMVDELGEVGAYHFADAVVRDWTDQAKESTSRLARALVAKGLSWPLAVARSAEVVGVPVRRLGRYATVAADRQVDPLSVADLADRALMEYASSQTAPMVTVSKESQSQSQSQRRRYVWRESEHPRDDLGQFTEKAKQAQATKEETKQRLLARQKRMEAARQRMVRFQSMAQSMPEQKTLSTRERLAVEQGERLSRREQLSQRQGGGSTRREALEQRGPLRDASGDEHTTKRFVHRVTADEVPLFEGDESRVYVVTDQPLYGIVFEVYKNPFFLDEGTEFVYEFDELYTRTNVDTAVRGAVNSITGVKGVQLVVFPPGTIGVHGAVLSTRVNGPYADAFYTTQWSSRTPKGDDQEDLYDRTLAETKWKNREGQVVIAEQVFVFRKDAGEREGQRQSQSRRYVWRESEHPRDQLGQFTEKGKQAQLVRTKAVERQKRMAAARQRMARFQAMAEAQQVTEEAAPPQQRLSRREQLAQQSGERLSRREQLAQRQAPVERAREAPKQQQAPKERQKPQQAGNVPPTFDFDAWVKPIGDGHYFAQVPGASMAPSLGFVKQARAADRSMSLLWHQRRAFYNSDRTRKYPLSEQLSAIRRRRASVPKKLAEVIDRGIATDLEQDAVAQGFKDAQALDDIHPFFAAMDVFDRPFMVQGGSGGSQSVAEKALWDFGHVAHFASPEDMRDQADIDSLDELNEEDYVFSDMLGVTPLSSVGSSLEYYVFRDRDGATKVGVRAPNSYIGRPRVGCALMSQPAALLVHQIALLSAPDGKLGNRAQERRKIMEADFRRYSNWNLTTAQMVQSRLGKLRFGVLPDQGRVPVARQALAVTSSPAVRLDGVDLYRIYTVDDAK